MKSLRSLLSLAVTMLLCAPLQGCIGGGGGGGDGDFIGAANVTIDLNPSTIDTGDRSMVSVNISEVNPNGIILKLRYPTGLDYVIDSAELSVDDEPFSIGPKVNQISDTESKTYLVFFLHRGTFGDSGRGTLTFLLQGIKAAKDGQIEVDADVDDPLKNNDSEFDISAPQFDAQDEASIEVEG